MALTVTATVSGAEAVTYPGLAVSVVNGASYTQNGATATSTAVTTPQLAITPHAVGSWVFAAVVTGATSGGFSSPAANTTSLLSQGQAGAGAWTVGAYRGTAATASTSSTTYGFTAPTEATGTILVASAELLASGTMSIDASTPAAVSTTVSLSVTTASFTPPGAAVLVAMVSTPWATSGTVVQAVTDSAGAYNWTQPAAATLSGGNLAGVWFGIPKNPPATATPALPLLSPPGRLAPGSIGRPWTPPPPPQAPYVNVTPGVATATATAQGPVPNVIPQPAAAAATATGRSPSVTASGTASPSAASATATAQGPVPNVTVTPAVATATATGKSPAAGGGTFVTPGTATATATGQSPALQVSPTVTPGVASATATGTSPAATVSPHPSAAAATATALAAPLHISQTVTPGVATATAQATLVGFPTPLVHWGVTISEPGINAVAAVRTVDSSLAVRSVNATLSVRTLNAVVTEGSMQQATLTLAEFNDMTIDFAVTANGSPYNLTGMTLNLLLKSAAGTPDTSALVFSSAGGSPAITITSALSGLATAQLPNADLDVESYSFYRLDVVNGSGQQQTTAYGGISWITL